MSNQYPMNKEPLQPSAFLFLPLGSVKPRGWLRRQLEIQANGPTGRLPDFWESLGPTSGWLGGDGESWERGPYYLDGLVPLAYLLEDERLIAIVQRWLDWMIESQDESGHFGPRTLDDWWPFAIACKVLTQYQEATGDKRVVPLLERFFAYMKRELPSRRLHTWAIARWADMVLGIIWLYNRNGDPGLLQLAWEIMHQGYDWSYHFRDFAHTEKQTKRFPMRTHVVNNAMGVKTPGIQYLLTGWDEHREGVYKALEMLDTYHGTAVGIFTGDEHYAGKNPTQGTETCAVVELMFSLENLMQIFADPLFGDRLEKIAYNALPAAFTADMWQHQYDQQANQVLCTIAERPWTNNGNEANVFGLEPNYGCCTANFHQGWPKFAANLWMATPDGGLAAVAYAPCEVKACVRGGAKVAVVVSTDYPFHDSIRMTIQTLTPVHFPISLRIPRWVELPIVKVNSGLISAEPGTFKTISREWKDGDCIELVFPMKVEKEIRFRDSISVSRGPLVYSLRIGERWEKIQNDSPCPTYEVYPTTPWNYGLVSDADFEVIEKDIGDVIFGSEYAPVELHTRARRIPEWQIEDNQAGMLPQSPVHSDEPEEEVTLIPYGCAKLRITEFPVVS